MSVAKKDDLSLLIPKMIPFTDGFVYLIIPPWPQEVIRNRNFIPAFTVKKAQDAV